MMTFSMIISVKKWFVMIILLWLLFLIVDRNSLHYYYYYPYQRKWRHQTNEQQEVKKINKQTRILDFFRLTCEHSTINKKLFNCWLTEWWSSDKQIDDNDDDDDQEKKILKEIIRFSNQTEQHRILFGCLAFFLPWRQRRQRWWKSK